MTLPLHGLVAATHTPFTATGELDLRPIEAQAAHLLRDGVHAAFIGGTTGESHSLTVDERLALAARWAEVTRGTRLALIIHVGTNCLTDAHMLIRQAGSLQVSAISALAPSYFKPRTVPDLVAWCAALAHAAPQLPFYFYDIPSMTGVNLPLDAFLEQAADRLPGLAGAKVSNPDLIAYQRAAHCSLGRFDLPWGTDECLLAALALGARGAVGSTYNFAAPLFHRLLAALERGDLASARIEQFRAVRLVDTLSRFGYMAAARATMGMLGVELGPPRLPHAPLSADQHASLRADLEAIDFFTWGRSSSIDLRQQKNP
jgi:N-acetylneuraminate lyase